MDAQTEETLAAAGEKIDKLHDMTLKGLDETAEARTMRKALHADWMTLDEEGKAGFVKVQGDLIRKYMERGEI